MSESEAVGYMVGYALGTVAVWGVMISVPVFVFLTWLNGRKALRAVRRLQSDAAKVAVWTPAERRSVQQGPI